MSDADVINLLIPHAELLTYEESSNVEFISDNNEEGRRQDQGTLEMTTEIFRIEEEEDQGTGVSDALPEAHDAAMQRNTYTDDEVNFGTSFSHSVDLDDTLPWEGSKPKVIIVVRRGNCLADLLAAFIDHDMMNKDVHIKRKPPNGELEKGEGSEMTAPQNTVARHLRIGESDNTTPKAFFRFCTGADILLGHSIAVQFIETSTFQCRPQAHTCGCYLMLPVNYQNYPDLRNDFDLILRSSVWVMDII
ncbi:hypothetical protein NQZ68_032220 [Dissostichus eleginoides]|nr:hypothetical protein NQZ68_032220 [Dissostichus eleginoides]